MLGDEIWGDIGSTWLQCNILTDIWTRSRASYVSLVKPQSHRQIDFIPTPKWPILRPPKKNHLVVPDCFSGVGAGGRGQLNDILGGLGLFHVFLVNKNSSCWLGCLPEACRQSNSWCLHFRASHRLSSEEPYAYLSLISESIFRITITNWLLACMFMRHQRKKDTCECVYYQCDCQDIPSIICNVTSFARLSVCGYKIY